MMTLAIEIRTLLGQMEDAPGDGYAWSIFNARLSDLLLDHVHEIADALEARDQAHEAGRLAGIEEAAKVAEGHVISGCALWTAK